MNIEDKLLIIDGIDRLNGRGSLNAAFSLLTEFLREMVQDINELTITTAGTTYSAPVFGNTLSTPAVVGNVTEATGDGDAFTLVGGRTISLNGAPTISDAVEEAEAAPKPKPRPAKRDAKKGVQ